MGVTYILMATVDDEEVFWSAYDDTTQLMYELDKCEDMVEKKLIEKNKCALCGEEMTANCNNGGCDV